MLFCQLLFVNPKFYLIWIVMVFISIWIHECAHALTAKHFGDDTAVRGHYLIPNPIKLMGIPAIISLLVIGITWGSVPVDYRKLRKGRMPPMLVALAGPLSNLVQYLFFCLAGILILKFAGGGVENDLFQMMSIGAVLNIVLFVLNLIPVPPLDGWIVSLCLFPGIARINQELRNGVILGIFVLVFFSFGYLFTYGQHAVVFTMRLFAYFFGI
ncbi:MAG TPA: hypothetical protein DD381_01100 [Lentisphaeria bacterium]|nr:MAG: hypothetical protein A2X47_05880 [Lentisphaerae bacterium GWF2_38_69]HBM14940.1 hypothetical protein [Lentisphaeria bacterium]